MIPQRKNGDIHSFLGRVLYYLKPVHLDAAAIRRFIMAIPCPPLSEEEDTIKYHHSLCVVLATPDLQLQGTAWSSGEFSVNW